jgi:hypothetical protein
VEHYLPEDDGDNTGKTGTRVPTPRKMTRKMICRESALLELGVHIYFCGQSTPGARAQAALDP